MILSDLTGDDESDPIYQRLQLSNLARQRDFSNAIVVASIAADRKYLSQNVIKALNFHAIACLHADAGDTAHGSSKSEPMFLRLTIEFQR